MMIMVTIDQMAAIRQRILGLYSRVRKSTCRWLSLRLAMPRPNMMLKMAM